MNSVLVPFPSAPDLPAPPFLLSIDLADGRVAVHGELDRHQVHGLAVAVSVLRHSPSPCWSIDVSAVTFCDVAGLRGLLGVQRLAARSGHRLVVTRPRPWLHRLLLLTDLDVLGADGAVGTSPLAPV